VSDCTECGDACSSCAGVIRDAIEAKRAAIAREVRESQRVEELRVKCVELESANASLRAENERLTAERTRQVLLTGLERGKGAAARDALARLVGYHGDDSFDCEAVYRQVADKIASIESALAAARSERDDAVRALTALRDWSVKTREEYRSGDRLVDVCGGLMVPMRVSAVDLHNGPIAVLLHVTGKCNAVLKAAGAAVADGEG
jgi:hypothetical protein